MTKVHRVSDGQLVNDSQSKYLKVCEVEIEVHFEHPW